MLMITSKRLWKYVAALTCIHFAIWLAVLFYEMSTLVQAFGSSPDQPRHRESGAEQAADVLLGILQQPGQALLDHVHFPHNDAVFFSIMVANSGLWGLSIVCATQYLARWRKSGNAR